MNFFRKFFHVPQSISSRGNGLSDAHFDGTAFDVVGIHRQQFVGSHQRDRYHVRLGLDGQKKCSRQKRFDLAIGRAAAFGENYQRQAALQAF